MATELIVRLLSPQGDCAWRTADATESGHGDLTDAGAAAAGRRVRLIVPGQDVFITRVALPVAQRNRARAAIPWALEERLVDEVESLHFALGQQHDGIWSVAVVARATLDDWLQRCARAGLAPDSIQPAPLALQLPAPGEWVALEEADQVLLRLDAYRGLACEPDLLEAVTANLELPGHIRRLGHTGHAWPARFEPLLGPIEPVADPVSAFAGDAVDTGQGIELLQGDYSRRERAGRRLRQWRIPAALALALALIGGVHLALDYAALGHRETALRAQLQAVFQRTFPDVQRTRDPRAQMAARLESMRRASNQEAGFADLLSRVGRVLETGTGATLTGLTWRAGTLQLEIATEDLPTLDRIQRGLTEAGLTADLRGAERGENTIEGRIRVEEPVE